MMDEETTRLWSSLEMLYMTKCFFNKLYLKKQLYEPRMNEGTVVLEVGASKLFQQGHQ